MNPFVSSQRLAACAGAFALSLATPTATVAEERNYNDFVAAALKHSRDLAARHHLVAHVTITTPEGRTLRYQYDQHPGVERLRVSEELAFTKKRGASWLRSDDWGRTGTPVDTEEGLDYDTLVSFVHAPLNSVTEARDASQGDSFMRLIQCNTEEGRERFLFEQSREQTKSDHVYPCLLFERFRNSEIPEALLCGFEGPLYTGDRILMVSITYDYRIKQPGRPSMRLAATHGSVAVGGIRVAIREDV